MFHEQQAADMNDRPLGYLEGPPVEVPPLPPNLSAPLSEERKAKIDDLRLQRDEQLREARRERLRLQKAQPTPMDRSRSCEIAPDPRATAHNKCQGPPDAMPLANGGSPGHDHPILEECPVGMKKYRRSDAVLTMSSLFRAPACRSCGTCASSLSSAPSPASSK